MRITPAISMKTLKVQKTWKDIIQNVRGHRCQPRLLYSTKHSITINDEIKRQRLTK